MAMMGHEIGKELIVALGLPKHTVGFTLSCHVGEVVHVQCMYYPEDGKAITTALMEYDLMPRFRPAAIVAQAASPHDFDTWYRKRIDVAHAKYMEHTSCHLRCDCSTKAITAYLSGPGV